MQQAYTVLAAAVLLAASVSANGTPLTNLYDDDLRTNWGTGFKFRHGTHLISYDSSSDQLTVLASQSVPDESPSFCVQPSPCLSTQHTLFHWTGRVDKNGRVTDSGSLTWFADFGAGMELLSEGRLLGVGVESINDFGVEGPIPPDSFVIYSDLHFLFDFDFRSPRLSGADSDTGILFFSYQLAPFSRDLFSTDFTCGSDIAVPEFCTGLAGWEAWSESWLLGQRTVPEPGTIALFGLGLAGLAFARRRRTGAFQGG